MVKTALFVKLEAKPGKEKDVEIFLQEALAPVNREASTITWYALKLGPGTFGIFDSFPDDYARKEHLKGEVAQALESRSAELFAKPPSIEMADIIAVKLP